MTYRTRQNFQGENIHGFVVVHSTASIFCESMAVSISNIIIQVCYHKGFPRNDDFSL